MKKFIALMLLIALAVPCCYAETKRVSLVPFVEKFVANRLAFGRNNLNPENVSSIFGEFINNDMVKVNENFYQVIVGNQLNMIWVDVEDLSVFGGLVPSNDYDFWLIFSILENRPDIMIDEGIAVKMVTANAISNDHPGTPYLFYSGNYDYCSYYIEGGGQFIRISYN